MARFFFLAEPLLMLAIGVGVAMGTSFVASKPKADLSQQNRIESDHPADAETAWKDAPKLTRLDRPAISFPPE
jgi:hypothetical protein